MLVTYKYFFKSNTGTDQNVFKVCYLKAFLFNTRC